MHIYGVDVGIILLSYLFPVNDRPIGSCDKQNPHAKVIYSIFFLFSVSVRSDPDIDYWLMQNMKSLYENNYVY